MKSILSAARQQGFEITICSDFHVEGRRGDYSLLYQRGVHNPLAHLKVGRGATETLVCQAFFHEKLEEQVAARILSLSLAGAE
jgi:hypothetical protein